jgi:D-glycerate 3-kinase
MHPLARRGPAFPRLVELGLGDEDGGAGFADWFDANVPPGPLHDERVHWLCVPVARWLEQRLTRATRRPFMLGLNAPQGAGKTTLAAGLVGAFREVLGVQALALSVDDFYLTRAEQRRLADRHPGNPFLEQRGYPGTHDVALGAHVLSALRAGVALDVPRYDKSAHGGLGDRSPTAHPVDGPVDLVILEGWLLGFTPVPRVEDPHLEVPNEALRAYEAWQTHLDALLVLEMADDTQVVAWRVEAEQAMRASGRPGLSDEAITAYVSRFLPAYRTWSPTLRHGRWQGEERFTLTLDARRVPVAAHGPRPADGPGTR